MGVAVTSIVKGAVTDVDPTAAVSVIGYVPEVVGLPEINPVAEFRVRPAGREVALNETPVYVLGIIL